MSRGGARPASREVATILAITPAGHVVARSRNSEVVAEGTPLTDGRGTFRGRVVRVFGPVAQPYLSVRPRRAPTPDEGLRWIGATLRPE